MAKKPTTPTEHASSEPMLRRCIGSHRFGIEPHDAPVGDFPRRPSQKDGLGRMCQVHWNQYTAGLARDAKARNAAPVEEPEPTPIAASRRPRAAREVTITPEGSATIE